MIGARNSECGLLKSTFMVVVYCLNNLGPESSNKIVMNLLCPVGRLRYANNSNYKNDTMIRKEVNKG